MEYEDRVATKMTNLYFVDVPIVFLKYGKRDGSARKGEYRTNKRYQELSHSLRYEGMVAYIFYIKARGIKIK